MARKKGDLSDVKKAVKLLIAGAIFFIALQREGVVDKIELNSVALILIAIFLVVDTLVNGRK